MFLTDVFSYADNKTKASLRESSKKTTSATTKHGNEKYPQTNNRMVKENTMKTRDILENSSYSPDLIAARGLIGKALHDQAARQEYFNFIKGLRDKHGADYSTKIHQAATELAKAKPAPLDEEENPKDIITLDVPLFIRLLEYAREDAKTDMDLHNVTERIISLSGQGNTLTMSEYNKIVGK